MQTTDRQTDVRRRSSHPALRVGGCATLAALLLAGPAAAQHRPDSTHRQHAPVGLAEPASSPGEGATVRAGAWSLALHGFATFGTSRHAGPRGAASGITTNMVSLAATRRVGAGELSFRVMGSAEAVMGADGYPLLLQTGESTDDLTPLRDRQHPHDLLAELAASYRRPLDPGLDGFVYTVSSSRRDRRSRVNMNETIAPRLARSQRRETPRPLPSGPAAGSAAVDTGCGPHVGIGPSRPIYHLHRSHHAAQRRRLLDHRRE